MAQKSPANSKEKIFVGDTFTKSFEHRKVDLTNLSNTRGLPGIVTTAYAQIYDVTNAVYLPIGGAGVFTAPATITPKTGNLSSDNGAIVTYTVSSAWTALAGDFSLMITYIYENNQVNTLKFRFRVTEKR